MSDALTYTEFIGFKNRNPNIEWSKAYQGIYVKDSYLGTVHVFQKADGTFIYTKVDPQLANNAGPPIDTSWWDTFATTFQTEVIDRTKSLAKGVGISVGVLAVIACIVLYLVYVPQGRKWISGS